MFNSNARTGNFTRAGKSAADDMVRSFAAARRNAPNYGEMAQKATQIRSKEKIAAMKAEQEVAQAGIKAKTDVKINKIKIDADTELRGAKRKAGALATAGKLFGSAGEFLGPERKKREVGAYDSYYTDRIDKARDKAGELREQAENVDLTGGFQPMEVPNFNQPSGDTNSSGGTVAARRTAPTNNNNSGGDGNTAMRLMTDLTNDGYTPVQAAAIAGNAQYESANFTAHEEFAPNAYGTKGAGFFQWTNAGGSNRRTSFENHAASQGLDPRSYEANTSYMMHELKGGAGNHWTGGMDDSSFRQINDLNTAVTSFQNNYLRPAAATANTSQRMSNAQNLLDQWNSQFR